jgi:Cu-processing system permease protein
VTDHPAAESDGAAERAADAGTTTPNGGIAERREFAAGREHGDHAVAPRRALAMADREYRVVARSRWPAGVAVLFAVVSGAVALASGAGVGATRGGAVVVSLAEFAVYLVPLVALTFGYGAVVGAAERGTLEMLFALPVPRRCLLVGTYLGRALALGAALVVGLGVGGLLVVDAAGAAAVGPYARLVVAAVATGLAFLSVSLLASTIAREKVHALGGVLLAWVWFVFAHDLVALAAVVTLRPPDSAVAALVLANPADLFRVLVLAGVETTGRGVSAVLAASSLSAPLAAAGLLAWVVLPLAAAVRAVGRVTRRA